MQVARASVARSVAMTAHVDAENPLRRPHVGPRVRRVVIKAEVVRLGDRVCRPDNPAERLVTNLRHTPRSAAYE